MSNLSDDGGWSKRPSEKKKEKNPTLCSWSKNVNRDAFSAFTSSVIVIVDTLHRYCGAPAFGDRFYFMLVFQLKL